MNNATIALALFALQEILKAAPGLYAELASVFAKDTVTDADWDALRARVLSKGYKDFVPATELPSTEVS